MQISTAARLQRAIPSAGIGLIAGALLVTLANVFPMILLWGVGPVIVGSILISTIPAGVHLKAWKAIAAVLLSLPAYFLAFLALAATASFAQSHGLRPSSLVSDMGTDTLCGLAVATLTACVEMELLSWLLSGYWSLRHAFLLVGAGLTVLAVTYRIGEVAQRTVSHPSNGIQLWLFFGPLFVVGGSLVTAIVDDQIRYKSNETPWKRGYR